jgi:aryl-alcohol dehydrogenase-like predicted oxidoreductase
VRKIALGTVQFGLDYGITNHSGQVAIDEVKDILNYAKTNNIDTLDTAARYGNSEQVLGEVGVNNYRIITKTTPLKNGVDGVIKGFHQSLDNLNIGQVEGLLIHNIDDTKDKRFGELFHKLNNLKEEGLINKIGFSTYTPDQVDFLLENFDFDLIQVSFNIFDNRLIQGGQLKALKKKKIEIHARSVFLQGLLLDFNNLSDYFLTWKNEFDIYQNVVKESGLSKLEYALNFALSVHEIDKVLVGVNSEDQLREIVSSVKGQGDLSAYPICDKNLLNPSNWGKL